MYKKVELPRNGLVGIEAQIREFWKDNEIIKKNADMNKGAKYFSFYDGPPTANGKPHVGHILTRVVKDIIPRYKVMKGYQVKRKAGWDTHGLPVELEIEKKLGISGKAQIEEYGIEKFIKDCKQSVFSYVSIWEDMSNKIAYWADMENPYVTYHNDYIESVWWALKQMWNKNLLYEGHKVMPYCPRCGTALSSHEVAQGYKEINDLTCIAKFAVEDKPNTFILAWTTTPWTLPSNLALCVNKEYTYVEAKVNSSKNKCVKPEETYILAKDLCNKLLGEDYEIIKEFKGEELLGTKYKQLMPFVRPEGKAFVVIHGDYVTLDEGTGIVHIAPAYGEEDSLVAKENGITFMNLVDKEGKFTKEVTLWSRKPVRKCDELIINYMKERNKLFKAERHVHSYPHCWRCNTPLLYYPKESWFVAMSKLREKLVENNNKINWYPDTIRTGRFGKFVENVIDWGISRDRYWGTPLPIWKCECGHMECIGSIEELKEKGIDVPEGIELHKPYIDDVHLKCEKCGKEMTRTKEVIDCWFDSGSMPFAQYHYPFENKELFEANYPANFISEAVDQTRGWFYTLLAVSTAIFDNNSFENCIVLGHVLDKKGLKMSKSKGNVVDPFEVMDKEGADATRWHFYTSSNPWLPTRFSVEDVGETSRRFLATLWNIYSFYVLYANIDKINPLEYKDFVSENIMDKWIISKLNTLVAEVEKELDEYDITGSALKIESFVDELSNWYVRRNRTRFWGNELTDDKLGAFVTLYRVLVTLSKVIAPYVPYIAEEIYQNLVRNLDKNEIESVHLCNWPEVNKNEIDKQLEKEMDLAYEIVKLGRSARNSAEMKNRQPLKLMLVSIKDLPEYYGEIIKDELNIKGIEFGADLSRFVDFKILPNLPVIGKKYGKLIPAIKAEIAKCDQMELATKINAGGAHTIHVGEEDIELSSENILVTMTGKEGYAFAGSGTMGIVLNTEIDIVLKREGFIREIISKVQNMRKEYRFEVLDRINLYVAGNKMLEKLVLDNEETIKKETLAIDVITRADKEHCREVDINGEKLFIKVEVAK